MTESKSMKMITLWLPKGYLTELEKLVGSGYYPNRAEAIRFAIHDLLVHAHGVTLP